MFIQLVSSSVARYRSTDNGFFRHNSVTRSTSTWAHNVATYYQSTKLPSFPLLCMFDPTQLYDLISNRGIVNDDESSAPLIWLCEMTEVKHRSKNCSRPSPVL
ncbi:hypothetical protein F2P81_001684 [Scophthalmus maximus]|uniref:Uncharacterized protein n=1 Tax=Scophthalmus maximus TaxID=52904 RepID=A0A6A4TIW6_SCOMX|nr:hypothetical protein F2P81_001684 [Scophthalmus maximus]